MNGLRMLNRQIYIHGAASAIAMGSGEVPIDVLASVCTTMEEAEKMHHYVNANRSTAK